MSSPKTFRIHFRDHGSITTKADYYQVDSWVDFYLDADMVLSLPKEVLLFISLVETDDDQ